MSCQILTQIYVAVDEGCELLEVLSRSLPLASRGVVRARERDATATYWWRRDTAFDAVTLRDAQFTAKETSHMFTGTSQTSGPQLQI